MVTSHAHGSGQSQAEQAFAEFLARKQAGEPLDFEAFCAAHRAAESELRRLHAGWQPLQRVLANVSVPTRTASTDLDPGIALDSDRIPAGSEMPGLFMHRLRDHTARYTRYVVREQLAVGGMGVVYKVWDQDLRRNLAMKVMRAKPLAPAPPEGNGNGNGNGHAAYDPRALGRFLEEAQITAQIDHPNIVAVHDIGLDETGRVYFTMPLVRGRSFKRIISLTRAGQEGWSVPRALRSLLQVCGALAFAHAKGVVHRDVKPSNVMVGRFGETYLMDWGLARIRDRVDVHGLKRSKTFEDSFEIVTDRHQAKESTPDSPLVTHYGDVVGTPSFMAPEQASGLIDAIDERTDVYALGAILYQLLTGFAPYDLPGLNRTARQIVAEQLAGPPMPVRQVDPSAPAELAAICAKAMAHDPRERYSNALALARDIEAYLGRRPVEAHGPGLAHVARLAYERHRAVVLTAALAIAVLLTVGTWLLLQRNSAFAETRVQLAHTQRLLDYRLARDLRALERLDPPLPPSQGALSTWLEREAGLTRKLADYRSELAAPRAEDPLSQAELADLVFWIEELGRARPQVEQRLALARDLADPSYFGQAAAWEEARAAIRADPRYGGLDLAPQTGLMPLGKNAQGYYEFWNVLSGARPLPDATEPGGWAIADETGIVLVLLPGGKAELGTTFETCPTEWSEPSHIEVLPPSLVAKYEVTQAQYARVMGANPSRFAAGEELKYAPLQPGQTITGRHPVENLSWFQAAEFARRIGCVLPGEWEWENAARAGKNTRFCYGEIADFEGAENLNDPSAEEVSDFRKEGDFVPWVDGFAAHAPVGSFRPNAFGLCDTHGNVFEWCQSTSDPARVNDPEASRSTRGGSFWHYIQYARVDLREWLRPGSSNPALGVRVAWPLDQRDRKAALEPR